MFVEQKANCCSFEVRLDMWLIVVLIISLVGSIQSSTFSSCIPNTNCQCYLTAHSFTFLNCSQKLTDLPIFHAQNIVNVTRIVAPNAFREWPVQLCKYKNVQILDLSGSNFQNSFVNFSCLTQLIHVNLSQTQLNRTPEFHRNMSNHLQFLDLSKNQIKHVDGSSFRSFPNLISIFLQENPIETIGNMSEFFLLPRLQSLNLISSGSNGIRLQPSINERYWEKIGELWSNSPRKTFVIRTKNLPFQNLISSKNSGKSMKVILSKLLDSTIFGSDQTPLCNCVDLRLYQRLFSSIDTLKKYSSALFQTTTCLLSDGVTHARLFDRRTYLDFRCPLLSKKNFFSSIPRLSFGSTIFSASKSFSFIVVLLVLLFKHV